MIDSLVDLVQTDFTARFGWTLIHFLWQGTIVAAGLAALLCLLRSANHRYLAACAAMLALAVLPIATFVHLSPGGAADVATVVAHNPGISPNMAGTVVGRPVGPGTEYTPRIAASDRPTTVVLDKTAIAPAVTRRLQPILTLCSVIWAAGVLVMGTRLLTGWIYVERARRSATAPIDLSWQQRIDVLARRMNIRRSVHLLCSGHVLGPTQIGWLRPVVLLPASLLTNLTPQELDSLLAHELAHIRRHDYLVNIVQSIVEAVLFYHPAVWWVSRVIRTEREYCCDDAALHLCAEPRIYVTALAFLGKLHAPPEPVALGATGGSLMRRIERICRPKAAIGFLPTLARSFPSVLGVGLAVVLVVVLTWNSHTTTNGDVPRSRPTLVSHTVKTGQPRPSPPGRHRNELDLSTNFPGVPEVHLERYGQLLISSQINRGEIYQDVVVRPAVPGPVVITVIPLNKGFQPLLYTAWPTAEGMDSDTNRSSGRGERPLQVVENRMSAPDNWIRVQVYTEFPGVDDLQMVGDHADYAVYIRQPPLSLRDLDPNSLGVESSPIVLDSSGYGRAHPGKNPDCVPALEWCHDVDTFQFESTSPGILTVTVDGTVGEFDPYLRLYDDQYNLLMQAPSSGPHRAVSLSIKAHRPQQRYYLAVASYDDATVGLYVVQVRQGVPRSRSQAK